MGKKGKRSGKTSNDKAKGPGKARRERAAAMREIEAGIDALIEKLEEELRDVDVFSPFAQRDDCPICFLPIPLGGDTGMYMQCCGKFICLGCSLASYKIKDGHDLCPFCRSGGSDPKEMVEKLTKRIDANDPVAMNCLAGYYHSGSSELGRDVGLGRNDVMSTRLTLRAAELGHRVSICNLAHDCFLGDRVEKNFNRGMKLAFAAAKMGLPVGHRQLAVYFANNGEDRDRAIKHMSYAARGGDLEAMQFIKDLRESEALGQKLYDEIEQDFLEVKKSEWSEEREEAEQFV